MLNRCSTPRSSSTPASDDNMPPSKAMLTFLRATAGKSKERKLSCCMTGVALLDRSFDQASAPESCGESRLPATSVAQKFCHHELFGLVGIKTGRLNGLAISKPRRRREKNPTAA